LKKYNIIINLLFWVLIAMIIFGALWLHLGYKGDVLKFFTRAEYENEKIIIKKEPVIINKKETELVEWFYFVATGYSADDPSQGTDNITATGKKIHEGVIAVDPYVIPLGTEVQIKDIGTFIAEDTGGKIKGNRIDIYFSTKKEAKDFGKKGIWLRIVEKADGTISVTDEKSLSVIY
jgi:3D (Asp-Asp-Asp) domain-containing protein